MVFLMSRSSVTTPIWLLLVLHVVLMVSLSFMFTPTFTSGLNALTPQLYGHGSALLTTLQQVAGAAGSALLITLMQARSQSLAAAGAGPVPALQGGVGFAMAVAAAIGLGAVLLALLMPGHKPSAEDPAAREPVSAEG